MVTHEIVVIRGREISVIFYYSDFSGCTLHPVYTIHCTESWPRHDKLLPSLSRMALQFLGVPASSAAVERLFSGVGKDFAKQRQGMSEQTLEEIIRATIDIFYMISI